MGLSDEEFGFVLTIGSGMATTIGASLVLIPQLANVASSRFLAASLAVSAGVMLYVSMIEIFVKSRNDFAESDEVDGDDPSEGDPYLYATLAFFGGMILAALLDKLVHCLDRGHSHHIDEIPSGFKAEPQVIDAEEKPRALEMVARSTTGASSAALVTATKSQTDTTDAPTPLATDSSVSKPTSGDEVAVEVAPDSSSEATAPDGTEVTASMRVVQPAFEEDAARLQRTGLFAALALAIHNLPEGLATYVAAVGDPKLGAALAIAIAIHNIPEGVCVAVPVFYASKSRLKGFLYAVLSGISEPVGALIGWIFLDSKSQPVVSGVLFGLVAGIMVFISVHEMIPTALKYDPNNQITTIGVSAGFVIMAASLVLFVAA